MLIKLSCLTDSSERSFGWMTAQKTLGQSLSCVPRLEQHIQSYACCAQQQRHMQGRTQCFFRLLYSKERCCANLTASYMLPHRCMTDRGADVDESLLMCLLLALYTLCLMCIAGI